MRGPSRASARSSLSNSSIRIPRSSLQNGTDSSHTILLPGACDTPAGSSCASQNVCFSPQLKRTVYESSCVRLRGCGFTSSITPSNPTKGEVTVGRTRTRSPGLNRAILPTNTTKSDDIVFASVPVIRNAAQRCVSEPIRRWHLRNRYTLSSGPLLLPSSTPFLRRSSQPAR